MTASIKQPRVLAIWASMMCLWTVGPSEAPIFGQTAQPTQQALEAQGEEADDDVEVVVEYPEQDDGQEVGAAQEGERSTEEGPEALQRRAGEQLADEAEGRTGVMGMYVQEDDARQPTVVEVGVASPAFNAGVRKGDVIVSFSGFEADSYRKWVDGIRRLVNESPEGKTLPIQVRRGDEVLSLRIRKPVSKADDPRLPMPMTPTLNQQAGQSGGQLPSGPLPPQGPMPRRGGGGNDVMVADFFGGQFGQQFGGANEHAVAQIFRIDSPPPQTVRPNAQPSVGERQADTQQLAGGQLGAQPGQQPPVQDQFGNEFQQLGNEAGAEQADRFGPAAGVGGAGGSQGLATSGGAAGNGGRIGLAGFRDAQAGLYVMLDVGGLPAGNYLVGIDDSGASGAGGNVGGVAPMPPTSPQGSGELQRPPQPGQTAPSNRPPQRGGAPAPAGPGGVQPQGSNQTLPQVPRTVLAQVVDDRQGGQLNAQGGEGAASQVRRGAPGAGQPGQANAAAPPQGASNTRPADGSGQVGGSLTGETPVPAGAGSAQGGVGGAGAAAPAITVGTLTVDESGTGRLQQVVEGVQVRNVVGQQIVIYAQDVPPDTPLPPNLDLGAAPLDPRSDAGQGVPGRTGSTSGVTGDLPRAVNPGGARANQAVNPQRAVAAGMIELLSSRPGAGDSGPRPPAASRPNTGEELR